MNTPTTNTLGAGPRVLLIDDDEVIAGSLRTYLSGNGCAVDIAADRGEAEGLMTANRYDVVVVDPYLTGAIHGDQDTLLTIVRTLQPAASKIVLTAYDTPELAQAVTDAGSARLLIKPQSVVSIGDIVVTSSKGR